MGSSSVDGESTRSPQEPHPHAQGSRYRSRYHQLRRLRARRRRSCRHPQLRGRPHHAVGGGLLARPARCSSVRWPSARRSPTPTARSARSSATWARTGRATTVDGKRYTPQEISARILMKLKRDAESYLGDTVTQAVITVPGVLRRRPAHRHQGGRPDRRARGAAHHQRAHRGRPRLRPRQGRRGRDGARVRPRRRHVRRVGARDRRRRVRGEVHPRRHPPRRRRLGPADHRLARQQFKAAHGVDLSSRPDGRAAPQGSRREGQDRAQPGAADADQPAVHHGHRRWPAAPRRVAQPRQVPGDDGRSDRALPHPVRAGARRMPASARATSTTSSSSVARRACRR